MTQTVSRSPTYACHYREAPQLTEADGCPTWVTRGGNFVIAITHARAGTELTRSANIDEYMLVLPPGVTAHITAGTEEQAVAGDTLTIVPPGTSRVAITAAGHVLRIFSNKASDLAEKAGNASVYADGAPEVRPLRNWPDPVGGFHVRSYDLTEYEIPGGPMIQPRMFRSTNMMINVFVPWHAVRDTTRLSPHWHDDFEQASITLEGEFVHHIRTPWGPDLAGWHADEHVEVSSPSVTVIPATLVHTTRNPDANTARLIDVFAPPRFDFSRREGMIRNEAEYPMPASEDDGWTPPKTAAVAWQSGGG